MGELDEIFDKKTPQEIYNEFITKYSNKETIIEVKNNVQQLEKDLENVTNASRRLDISFLQNLQKTLNKMVEHIPQKKEYNKVKRFIVGFFEKFLPEKMPQKVKSWQEKIQNYKSAKSEKRAKEIIAKNKTFINSKQTIDIHLEQRTPNRFGKPKTARGRGK